MFFENSSSASTSSGNRQASSRYNFESPLNHRNVSFIETYSCEVCCKQYAYKNSLDLHLKYNPFCQQIESILFVPTQESEKPDSVQGLSNFQKIDQISLPHNLRSLDDELQNEQIFSEDSLDSEGTWPQPLVIIIDEDDEKLDFSKTFRPTSIHALPNVINTQISSSSASPEHSKNLPNLRSSEPLPLDGFSSEKCSRDNDVQSSSLHATDNQPSSLPTTTLNLQHADILNNSNCQKNESSFYEEPVKESEQPIVIAENDASDSMQSAKSPNFKMVPSSMQVDNEHCNSSSSKSSTNSKHSQTKATASIHSKSPSKIISSENVPTTSNNAMVTNTNSKPFKCPECKKDFNRKKGLYKHLEVHRKIIRTCQACGKVFNSSSGLHKHKSKNSECKYFLASSLHVRQEQNKPLNGTTPKPPLTGLHLTSGASNATLSNRDLQGPESIANLDMASTSMAKNADSQSFKCPMCPSRFNDQSRLKHHMHVHTTIKPFSCDVCGQKYTNKKSLYVHKKKHAKASPPNDLQTSVSAS